MNPSDLSDNTVWIAFESNFLQSKAAAGERLQMEQAKASKQVGIIAKQTFRFDCPLCGGLWFTL